MLSEQERTRLEKRLLDERQKAATALRELGTDLEYSEERSGELSRMPTHLADRGSDVQEEEMDITLAEQQAERLRKIDEALSRLREAPGEFDQSIVSGRRIPFERLDLVPWTRVLADEDQA
jgi:RNA polymerase-binding transcription factor DksA